MDRKLEQFFNQAKTLRLSAQEKVFMIAELLAFVSRYPFRSRAVSTEDAGIFFARGEDRQETVRFSELFDSAKLFGLTPSEKSDIRRNLFAYMAAHPVHLRFDFRAFFASYAVVFGRPRTALAGLAAVIFFSGAGVIYAAKGSLPGDALYSVKVAAFEEVPSLFARTEAAKVKWEAVKAENRLAEAETLAVGGMLDQETAEFIQRDLSQRIARVDRWEESAEERHTALAEGIDESLLRVKALADASFTLNEAFANTEEDIEKAAEETLATTEARIAEIRVSLVKAKDLPKDTAKEIRKRLRTADRVIVEGRARLRADEFREAYVLFQEGYILATEAEKFLPVEESSSD